MLFFLILLPNSSLPGYLLALYQPKTCACPQSCPTAGPHVFTAHVELHLTESLNFKHLFRSRGISGISHAEHVTREEFRE